MSSYEQGPHFYIGSSEYKAAFYNTGNPYFFRTSSLKALLGRDWTRFMNFLGDRVTRNSSFVIGCLANSFFKRGIKDQFERNVFHNPLGYASMEENIADLLSSLCSFVANKLRKLGATEEELKGRLIISPAFLRFVIDCCSNHPTHKLHRVGRELKDALFGYKVIKKNNRQGNHKVLKFFDMSHFFGYLASVYGFREFLGYEPVKIKRRLLRSDTWQGAFLAQILWLDRVHLKTRYNRDFKNYLVKLPDPDFRPFSLAYSRGN